MRDGSFTLQTSVVDSDNDNIRFGLIGCVAPENTTSHFCNDDCVSIRLLHPLTACASFVSAGV